MEENNTQTTQSDSQSVASSESAGSTVTTKAVAIIVVFGLAAVGLWYFLGSEKSPGDATATTQEEGAERGPAKEYPEIVAVINGEEVPKEDYLMSYNQTEQIALQQGADPSDAIVGSQIESQALDVLVNTVLLLQAADAAEASVTDEDVSTELAAIKAQYDTPEAFEQALNDNSLTLEQVESDIRDRLKIDAYLETTTGLSALEVTEAEVQEFYDSFAADTEEVPPLEEVYEPITQQLTAQKQQEAVDGVIQTLRDQAEIEIRI